MDNANHTVTIPMKDYLEIEKLKNQNESLIAHFKILFECGIEINDGNLNKTPKTARSITDTQNNKINVYFEY